MLRPFVLSTVVRELRPELLRAVPTGIALHRDLSRGLPPVVGDPEAISAMVLSLVQQAVSTMDGSGVIQIRTWSSPDTAATDAERPTMPGHGGARPPGDHVVLEVADTGEGLSGRDTPEMRLVREVVERHHGLLRVISQRRLGTRVRIWFPASLAVRTIPRRDTT